MATALQLATQDIARCDHLHENMSVLHETSPVGAGKQMEWLSAYCRTSRTAGKHLMDSGYILYTHYSLKEVLTHPMVYPYLPDQLFHCSIHSYPLFLPYVSPEWKVGKHLLIAGKHLLEPMASS